MRYNAFWFSVLTFLTFGLFRPYSRYFAFDFRIFSPLFVLFRIWLLRFFRFYSRYFAFDFRVFSPLFALFRLYLHYNAFQFCVISLLFAFLRLSFAWLRLWCNIFFLGRTLLGFRNLRRSASVLFVTFSFRFHTLWKEHLIRNYTV